MDTRIGVVELLGETDAHKYLGRLFPGELRNRGKRALEDRVRIAWGKFSTLRTTLVNRNISMKSRLRLFDAVITPTILYGLETAPLTQANFNRLDAVQRRMLRYVVGWHGLGPNLSFEEKGHIMKGRLTTALRVHPISAWAEIVQGKKARIKGRVSQLPLLTRLAIEWDVLATAPMNQANCGTPFRRQGRPLSRW